MNHEKELAARSSLRFIKDGMVLGLGSGSTAEIAIEIIGSAGFKGISGVATSKAAANLAGKAGIRLVDLNDVTSIDLTVDGADEIGPDLSLIKGGGGALLREKLVAEASRSMIVVADSTKLVSQLGRFPLPVEVIPFNWTHVQAKLEAMSLRPRLRSAHGGPFVTDQGNYILDCSCGEIAEPYTLARNLKAVSGVVEHGLFLGLATLALVAHSDGRIEEIRSIRREARDSDQ